MNNTPSPKSKRARSYAARPAAGSFGLKEERSDNIAAEQAGQNTRKPNRQAVNRMIRPPPPTIRSASAQCDSDARGAVRDRIRPGREAVTDGVMFSAPFPGPPVGRSTEKPEAEVGWVGEGVAVGCGTATETPRRGPLFLSTRKPVSAMPANAPPDAGSRSSPRSRSAPHSFGAASLPSSIPGVAAHIA